MQSEQAQEPYDFSAPVGNEYRFCGGRILIGPDFKSLLLSALLIFAPSGVFLGLVAPYLGRHVSWALVAITCVIIVVVAVALAMTAFRDPGYIPRSEDDNDCGLRAPTKDHLVNGYTVTTKWCPTCNHYRPPRCFHCAVCDACVDKFDHHCPWVGTCIGRRNYRYFLIFIFSTTALCCWVFALCLVNLILASRDSESGDFSNAISDYPAAIVLMGYTFLAFWFVGGLSAFHIYLSSSNQTTCEHVRRRYTDNPYSTTLSRNCAEVFCTAIPPRHTPLLPKQLLEMAQEAAANPQQQQQQQYQQQQYYQQYQPQHQQQYQPTNGGGDVEMRAHYGTAYAQQQAQDDAAYAAAGGDTGHVSLSISAGSPVGGVVPQGAPAPGYAPSSSDDSSSRAWEDRSMGLQSPTPTHRTRLGHQLGGSNGVGVGVAAVAAAAPPAPAAAAGGAEAPGGEEEEGEEEEEGRAAVVQQQQQLPNRLRWRDLRQGQGAPTDGSEGQAGYHDPTAVGAFNLQSPRPSIDRGG